MKVLTDPAQAGAMPAPVPAGERAPAPGPRSAPGAFAMQTLTPPTDEPPVAPPDDGPAPAAPPPPDDTARLVARKRRMIIGTALLAAVPVLLTLGVVPWYVSLGLAVAWLGLAALARLGMTELDWDPWHLADAAATGFLMLAGYALSTAFSARGWWP